MSAASSAPWRDEGVTAVESARIIGAGATATSALVALAELGAERVEVVARRPEAAAALMTLGEELGIGVTAAPLPQTEAVAVPLTVATLPGDAAMPDAAARTLAMSGGLLLDVVYGTWPTALATVWQRGGRTRRPRTRDAAAPGRPADAGVLDRAHRRAAARRGGRARRHAPRAPWETRGMLRVLTAGESHGPELVAIMEGLPSGVPISLDGDPRRPRSPQARLRPRLAHEVRGGRAVAVRRRRPRPQPRQPHRPAHRQHRVAQVDRGDEPRARRSHRPLARPRCGPHPPAPRSRRSGRHAEVRLRRGPADPRARERP